MIIPFNKKSITIMTYCGIILIVALFTFGIIYACHSRDLQLLVIMIICSPFLPLALITDYRKGILTHYVEINKDGISYVSRRKKSTMKWGEVKLIGYSKIGIGKSRAFIFAKKNDLTVFKQVCDVKNISNDFIYLANRKGLVEEVKKYWDKNIEDEEKYRYPQG